MAFQELYGKYFINYKHFFLYLMLIGFLNIIQLNRYFLWLWLVFERPSKHPHISGKELTYIEQSLGTASQAAMPGFWNTPWKEFATSPPVCIFAVLIKSVGT